MSALASSWGELRRVDPSSRPLVFHFLPDEEVIFVDNEHLAEWEELLAARCGITITPELRRQRTGSGTMGSCGSVGLDYCDDD